MFILTYSHFDGPYKDDTDAKYLSIGIAPGRGEDDPDPISAKVKRYLEDARKWSRRGDEIPLHRLADLGILLVKTLLEDEKPAIILSDETFENQ